MEKYRSSADPSTGIHPFLPPARLPAWRIVLQGAILYPLRLPAALLMLTLHLVPQLIAVVLHLALVHEPACALERISALALQVTLLCVGVQSNAPEGRLPRAPTHGDLLFTNHASYLDIPYMIAAFCPAGFAIPRSDGQLFVLSPYAALLWALRGGGELPPSSSTLTDAAESARTRRAGPVVVLAEGCATNGGGVLRFAPPANSVRGPCFALGMRYSRSRFECFTVGSGRIHVLALIANMGATLESRISHIPDATKVNLQREVARLAGVPTLRIGLEERAKFIAHWERTSGGHGIEQYRR